jgi:hypothetical protein
LTSSPKILRMRRTPESHGKASIGTSTTTFWSAHDTPVEEATCVDTQQLVVADEAESKNLIVLRLWAATTILVDEVCSGAVGEQG